MKVSAFMLSFALIVFGCEPDTVAENHKITKIENGKVWGENVTGHGEGIYYTLEELQAVGVDVIKLEEGDVLSFEWAAHDFYNGNWSDFEAEILEGGGEQ